jgi:hypothetical protein
MMTRMEYEHLRIFGSFLVVGWFHFIYVWPRILMPRHTSFGSNEAVAEPLVIPFLMVMCHELPDRVVSKNWICLKTWDLGCEINATLQLIDIPQKLKSIL